LNVAGVDLNRKMLAEMAVRDPESFGQIAAKAREALGQPAPAEEPAPAAVAKAVADAEAAAETADEAEPEKPAEEA
jgi:hypothetical protein